MITNHGGPGTFAYSPLDPTMAGSTTNPAFPDGRLGELRGRKPLRSWARTRSPALPGWMSAGLALPLLPPLDPRGFP